MYWVRFIFYVNHSIWGQYAESPYQTNEVRLLFTNGESCPGAIDRETEVSFPSSFH